MGSIQIQGGFPLHGEVSIQGSKNAALPVLAACVLVPGVTVLKNCPDISDVSCMCEILKYTGVKVEKQKDALILDAADISVCKLPEEYVTRMRSSVVLAGAMLGRCKEIYLHYPGGCVIGDRPIDLHLEALKQLGVRATEDGANLSMKADHLLGADIRLPFPSVGATENAILAAVLAEGTTTLLGCAKEPEIEVLCDFLNGAGAKIRFRSDDSMVIEGVKSLRESTFFIESDRIVAGTYLIGTLAAGGDSFLRNARTDRMESILSIARRMGAELSENPQGLRVKRTKPLLSPGALQTQCYPGLPTDMQSLLLVALCQAKGESSLAEQIFNGRFVVVEDLNRMGARINVRDNCAYMEGDSRLLGGNVCAQELRGGAALVLAGLCANGVTQVHNRHFIDRGYEDIVRDLGGLGVKIGSETE